VQRISESKISQLSQLSQHRIDSSRFFRMDEKTMVDEIKKFLEDNDWVYDVPIKRSKSLKRIYDLFIHNKPHKVKRSIELTYYGDYYYIKKDYESTMKYYLMAIKKGDSNAMANLGCYYEEQEDYENMKKYYLMAIKKGNSNAMCCLGDYYKDQEDYEIMKRYYFMGIEKGDSYAMYNLGEHYSDKEDYDNMKIYYLMAIEEGDSDAMYSLGEHYENVEDYHNMKIYYLMAIKEGDLDAMISLGDYYKKQEDYENMKKYYLMACGDSSANKKCDPKAMIKLGNYYKEQEDFENMKKYCLMALEKDNQQGMELLEAHYNEHNDYVNLICLYDRRIHLDPNYNYKPILVSAFKKLLNSIDTEEIPEKVLKIVINLDLQSFENVPLCLKVIHKSLKYSIDILDLHFKYSLQGKGFEDAKNDYLKSVTIQ